ncbi:MAG: CHASE2 domain-containing serine/threonine-protein kinase [Desulfobacterales bacterium]
MSLKRNARIYTLSLIMITLAVVAGYAVQFPALRYLEVKVFDRLAAWRSPAAAGRVVLVAIDEESLDRMGGWPWPRRCLAEVIDRLSDAGASAIGLAVMLHAPAAPPENNVWSHSGGLPATGGPSIQPVALGGRVPAGMDRYGDPQLIEAVRSARHVVLPLRFAGGSAPPLGPRLQALLRIHTAPVEGFPPDSESSLIRWRGRFDDWASPPEFPSTIISPYPDLAGKAGGLGHVNVATDIDGLLRSEILLIRHEGRWVPSLSLQLAVQATGGDIRGLTVDSPFGFGPRITAGGLRIPTDAGFRYYLDGPSPLERVDRVSFIDVLEGRVEAGYLRDRIVLIGPTAAALAERYRHPSGRWATPVEFSAAVVGSLIAGRPIDRPAWGAFLEVGIVLYVALFLWMVVPRIQLRVGGLMLSVFLLTWGGTVILLFREYGYWLHLFPPAILALLGFSFAVRRREIDSAFRQTADLSRTLALSYRGQGQLEMAARQLLAIPAEERSTREALYELAGDFERKRLYDRAADVYGHLIRGGRFRDARQRLRQLRSTGRASLGNGLVESGRTVVLVDGTAHPTFGRYEVISELGHGAMGTVFLGRDPKINREVAIKTLDYASLPAAELEDMKARFFREAQAAGNLSHPSIVTIFDVGEEHDMAYMAMERLEGVDLSAHSRPDSLLPVPQVAAAMLAVAEALDYAHSQGVVHRDIKPANIMLLKNGEVKVTDFGIARIMDHSKTRTGIVLGTPFYMSPEQVAGKKVDGRSDLFSLGVVFYEMLSGRRPFEGENVTSLMYAISKSPHTPLVRWVPDVPECCAAIVERLLKKGVTRRFRSAGDLADELRASLKRIGGQQAVAKRI